MTKIAKNDQKRPKMTKKGSKNRSPLSGELSLWEIDLEGTFRNRFLPFFDPKPRKNGRGLSDRSWQNRRGSKNLGYIYIYTRVVQNLGGGSKNEGVKKEPKK